MLLFQNAKTCEHIGCFVNICDAALYILFLEGQKGANIWGVVNILGVKICEVRQYTIYWVKIKNKMNFSNKESPQKNQMGST